MPKRVLSERHYKVGYVVRTELVDGQEYGVDDFEMKSAYTPSGDYIGNPKDARFLVAKKGIKPQKRNADSNVCSIGFNEEEQKWYGWSHRAIYGFVIGDVVKEGDCCATSGWTDEYLATHTDEDVLPIGFEAKNLNDAKKMAIAFAASVS